MGRKPKRETFGLDVRQLKVWNQMRIQQQLDTEIVKQEIAVARVRGFLDAIASVVRLQSWWRMIRVRRKYEEWLVERRAVRRKYYRSWKIFWRSERMHLVSIHSMVLSLHSNGLPVIASSARQILCGMERRSS